MGTAPEGFTASTFTHDGVTRDVYERGSGPAVIVMAEMPGITPRVLEFARRVADVGLTAVVPRLFGDVGRAPSPAYYAQSIVPACVAAEFAAFARGRTAPITDWLRALAADAHARCGGPGVGAVGMCWTGGFALGMMLDDRMLAPVLSQPSLPIGLSSKHRRDLHLAAADLQTVKARAAEGACVLGLRFTGVKLAPPERFAALRSELGDAFIDVEIDSSPGNEHGIRRVAHSVLTEDLVDEPGHPTHDALLQVLDFLTTRLEAAS
jgi:dienelactone hydrolase